MTPATISLEVDPESARAFSEAPAEERRKLQLLLRLRLRELTSGPSRPLKQTMDEIGQEADFGRDRVRAKTPNARRT